MIVSPMSSREDPGSATGRHRDAAPSVQARVQVSRPATAPRVQGLRVVLAEHPLGVGTGAEASACYRAVPRNRPLRPDGRPNRPLTMFTVMLA
jgi:hypothetical protein